MSIYYDPRPLRTLPLYTASAEGRRVLQRRAEYVPAQLARDREALSGSQADNLDPVLRSHLELG